MLQTSHIPQPVLFQNGRQVGLGDVVHKGAVAEDHGAVPGGGKLGMPLGDTQGQRLDLLAGDLLVEAGDQRPGADGIGKGAYIASKPGSARTLELGGKAFAKSSQVREGLLFHMSV